MLKDLDSMIITRSRFKTLLIYFLFLCAKKRNVFRQTLMAPVDLLTGDREANGLGNYQK